MSVRRAGLTLVELLIAMSIGSVVLASVLGVLSTARRTQQTGEARSDLFQSVRVALNQLGRDLSVAVDREDDWQFDFLATDEVVNNLPMDTVEFASASGDPLSSLLPTGDLVRVQYYIDIDENTEQSGLVRSAMSIPLLEEIPPEQAQLAARTYCPWAVGLELQYYDPLEQTWVEDWDERTDLPTSMRIVLYVLPPDLEEDRDSDIEDMMPFSTVVYLALSDVPLGTGHVQEEEQTGPQGGMGGEETEPEPGSEEGAPELPSPFGEGGIPGMPMPMPGGGGAR